MKVKSSFAILTAARNVYSSMMMALSKTAHR
jgi:hypothetical protein